MSPSGSLRAFATACSAALLAAACADDSAVLAPPGFMANTSASALGATYKIGIGDKLKITVFGEDSLSGPVEVNGAGHVSLPLAGEVKAQGLTIPQFRDAVTRRLADGYLKSPKITVDITNYRPIYVHGEVKSGGEFPYKSGLRLRDAVAMAGGYTYRANQKYVLVVREGQDEVRVPASATVSILPGDNIRIPERFF